MSEENIFKRLAEMKKYKPVKKDCNICENGLVHVRHTETKTAHVFKCLCPLGNRPEAYPFWTKSLEFEPMFEIPKDDGK